MTIMKCPVCNKGEITKKRIQYGLQEAIVEICDNCGWLVSPMSAVMSDVEIVIQDGKQKQENC